MARLVLTQPEPRVARIAARLRAAGHAVLECPVRRLVAVEPSQAPDVEVLHRHDWVVFVSPGAVEFGLSGLTRTWPDGVGIAVIGPGTAASLARCPAIGPDARVIRPASAPYDAGALIALPEFRDPAGLRVLVLRGESGRDDWIDHLRALGADVEVRAVHRVESLPVNAAALERLGAWRVAGEPVVFVFTSVDAVTGLDAALSTNGSRAWAHGQRALAQHPRIVAALRTAGWRHAGLIEPGESGLLRAIESEVDVGASRGSPARD
ncbi:MAG: hypothetical protein RIS35_2615 [Pseudomonadota bacterium]|jgi:uroporphyrinogen-III synthase